MFISIMAFSVLASFKAPNLNFINLDVRASDRDMEVRARVSPLHRLNWDNESSTDTAKLYLDGPLSTVGDLLTQIDAVRDELWPRGLRSPVQLMRFRFELIAREESGKRLTRKTYDVVVSLGEIPDLGVIEHDGDIATFSINSLSQPDGYAEFLYKLSFPFRVTEMNLPKRDSFVLSLAYQWPRQLSGLSRIRNKVNLRSIFFNDNYDEDSLTIELGSTWCVNNGGALTTYTSRFLHFRNDINTALAEDMTSPELLATYLEKSPGDGAALAAMLNHYRTTDKPGKALDMVRSYRSLMGDRISDEDIDAIEGAWKEKREHLLVNRSTFTQDPNLKLVIETPTDGDAIGGDHVMAFSVENAPSLLIGSELYIDGELKVYDKKGRNEMPIRIDRGKKERKLKLKTYFQNRTFAESEITVEVVPVDVQASVNLRRLHVVVTKGADEFVTDLDQSKFFIQESERSRKVENFRLGTGPLRVAVVIDNSHSMSGKKMQRAQYAVRSFLDQLGSEDKVAVYAFDDDVVRLKGFEEDKQSVLPDLFTMIPIGSTSLYDAVTVAHKDLQKQDGTPVIIAISDGEDTVSSTTRRQITDLLRGSSTMLYSILLYRNSDEQARNEAMRELSGLTGSLYYEFRDPNQMENAFERILSELKSYYYLDYYSPLRSVKPGMIFLWLGSEYTSRIRIIQ